MKQNILMFIPSIDDGGVEKNLFLISNYLNENNFNVEILTCNFDKKNKFNRNINFLGIKSNFLQNKSKKIKYLFCLTILFFNLLFRKEKTLVFAFQANIYAVIVAKILNTKVITRSNTAPSGWSRNFIKNNIYKLIIKLADDVMVNSLEFKKNFSSNFNIDAKCIYNPFNKNFVIKNIKKNKRNTSFFKKNYLNVVSVGRLTDQKDHLTLLEAINLLSPNFKIRVAIIGKGVMKNSLQKYIIDKKLQNKVKLIGYLNNPFPYIHRSNILVLTSKFEGLPNILLEGQYLKKHIISTNCPTGPKEILLDGKAGDLIKIGDFKKLSYLIKKNNSRKKIINNKIKVGYKNFGRFDYDLNCKKYLDFVNKNI